jgi:hypothetical protein
MLNGVKHVGSPPRPFADDEILRLRAQNDTLRDPEHREP